MELQLREGEVIKLKRGQKLVPLLSVDIPVEVQEASTDQPTQKTYMLKMICPAGCVNKRGKPLTVRMTEVNSLPGVKCGNCGTAMVEAPPGEREDA